MDTLTNNKLANALSTLRRRILSLNYNGYFTRNLFSELKDVLGLWVAFRIHSNEKDEKFHSYGQHDDHTKEFLTKISTSLTGEKENLKVILNELKDNNSSYDVEIKKIDPPVEVESEMFSPSVVRNDEGYPLPVQSKIDIPLLVKYCRTCNAFFEYDQTKCLNCPEHSLLAELRGIIRLYSCLGQEDLSQLLNSLKDGQGTFGQRICRLFALQEQPDCFTTYTENKAECERCRYIDHCSLVKAKGKKGPLHPDEVLHQLQERCRGILGLDYELPILIYDVKERNLRYKAIDYLKAPEDVMVIRDKLLKKFPSSKNKVIAASKNYPIEIQENIATIFNSKDIQKISKASIKVFGIIIQDIDRGVTKHVWHTWESIDLIDIEFPVLFKDPNETLRTFVEALFFTGKEDAIILTPLGYMGQKHGLIFSMVPGTKRDQLKEVKETFLRIAKEFAPLLFHSLEYQMYHRALNSLEDSTIDQVPNILLDVFPIGFNLVAGAFWSKAQIDRKDFNVPCFLHAFRESDSKVSKIPDSKGLNLCSLMDLKDEKQEFFKQELAQNSYRISECWETGSTIAAPFTCIDSSTGRGDERNKNKPDIRSRLLVAVGTADDQVFPSQLRGVFELYFDQSHYVLHRHALDLAREIRFVYTQTANAAKQKQEVIKHAIKAAVSAIISRNHSHHIGSHVTPRTSVKDIEKRLDKLGYVFDKDENKLNVIGTLKSRLDEYIQKKADFMAEIATEPLTTTISKSFFREVLLYFIQNTLLTDNIGANEGVNYKNQDGKSENRLKIHFFFKGKELDARFSGGCGKDCKIFDHMHLPYTGLCDCDKTKELWLTNPEGEDVTIAWPGPLGEFSFYCFLENFIRNAIKHNYENLRDNRPLNIYVSVNELEEDDQERHEFYKIEVWEDATDPCKQIPVTIDEKSETTTLKKHLAGLIDSKIVDNQGRLNKGAWGIAEMKIMATLMRGSDDFTSMNSNLNVGCCKRNGKDRLIYEFRVMKPKEIAIIAKTSPKDDKRIQHRNQGIWWFNSFDELKAHQTHGLSPATFNIVVIDKAAYAEDKEKIANLSHLLPYRVIIDDQDEESGHCTELPGVSKAKIDWNGLKNNEANEIISDFWDKWVAWLMKKNGYKNPRIDLFLQQKMGETPTNEWKEKTESWEQENKAVKVSVISKEGEIAPNVCNDEIHFVYDRHFRGVDFLTTTREVNSNLNLLKFHEAFDKCSSDFVPIFASSPTSKMIYQLAEAAFLNVLIIDERVAEVAYKAILENSNNYYKIFYGNSFQRLHVAKGANIFIATHLQIDDGPVSCVHYSTKGESPRVCVRCKTSSDLASATSRVDEFKVYWCNGNDCGECKSTEKIELQPNALIMHQGITEGLFKKAILCNNKTETFANALTAFLDDLKKHVPYVVIDSGRGIPANLPDSAKFLPFSLIEDYLMKDRMAKFSLTRVLMSIIREAKE